MGKLKYTCEYCEGDVAEDDMFIISHTAANMCHECYDRIDQEVWEKRQAKIKEVALRERERELDRWRRR